MKAFKEVKQHEFRLINMYRPDTLTANFDAFLNEYQDKERTSALQIDTKKFKDREQREGYVEEVKESYMKNSELKP